MDENKKDNNKNTGKFKFNTYWIYGAVILLLISFQIFSGGDLASQSISKNEFNEVLRENDISKIIVVNNNVAQVFIKEDALSKSKYQKLTNSAFYRKGESLYEYNFGDLQNFENDLERARKENQLTFDLKNEGRTSMVDTLLGFLPFIILIAVWLFFMKRMSGGGAGAGGGGQIFSIGKSKAKLFDKDTKVKTTFANVAGLEGAQEEVQEIVDFLKNPEKYTSLGPPIGLLPTKAPCACAQSSITLMPCLFAKSMMAGILQGQPPTCTGIMTLVLFEINGRIVSGLILPLSISTSANIGFAPIIITQLAEAT